jgi:hypothetical protein
MEKFNRAVRRHHVKRLKAKRKTYWGYPRLERYGPGNIPLGPDRMNAHQLGKVVQYPQACSCAGCGNVRRNAWMNYAERTREEIAHEIKQYESDYEDACTSENAVEEDAVQFPVPHRWR